VRFPLELRKIRALARRDFYDWSSYKNQTITTILAAGVGLASWGLNASYRNVTVPDYNTDFVSFLVVGVMVGGIILSLGAGLDRRIKPWTIETLLMTGIRTPTFVLGAVTWTYILAAILFIPQVLISIFVFQASFSVDIISLAVAVVISSAIIFSLSMIATGLRLVTKVNDPITWGLAVASQMLSGMTFPVSHLNDYIPGLSTVSWFLPQTWVYHIIRLASLTDGSLLDSSVALSFLGALVYAILLIPLALWVFHWGLNRAKRDGTLGWY
jgi:ABC-type multidrug transport system permease subunit